MKWEYLVTVDDGNISELGIQGWELVSVAQKNNEMKLYFKRPVQSLSVRITSEQRKAVFKDFLEGAE
ncbi:hypothetical protein [Virgibacillus necropolis]|uniref:DUF4177 domain-containing protein n=1 Tax=Virgibacillus necropolis TaxID=163877 RepID=A0A221M986_9BACI|nr:hypothetical protein [Virgibacillus necropolis]ASN04191.1 hypothetical protein CFK40_03795 [Virgibacillus necropolis]